MIQPNGQSDVTTTVHTDRIEESEKYMSNPRDIDIPVNKIHTSSRRERGQKLKTKNEWIKLEGKNVLMRKVETYVVVCYHLVGVVRFKLLNQTGNKQSQRGLRCREDVTWMMTSQCTWYSTLRSLADHKSLKLTSRSDSRSFLVLRFPSFNSTWKAARTQYVTTFVHSIYISRESPICNRRLCCM